VDQSQLVFCTGSKIEHVLFHIDCRYQQKSVPETYDTLTGLWYQLTGTGFWYQKLVRVCVVGFMLHLRNCHLHGLYLYLHASNLSRYCHHVFLTVKRMKMTGYDTTDRR